MKPSPRLALGLVAAALLMTHFLGSAHAQSSLGIGTNDGMAPTASGPFAHILMWINLSPPRRAKKATTATPPSVRQY